MPPRNLVFERDAAGNRDRVFTETTMNRELARTPFAEVVTLVDDRQQRIGWTSGDHCGLAHRRTRLNERSSALSFTVSGVTSAP